MEIPSSAAGVVKELKVKVGDKVSKGTRRSLAARGRAGGARQRRRPRSGGHRASATAPAAGGGSRRAAPAPERAAPAAASPSRAPSPTAALPAHEPTAPHGRLPHASPSIRKLARELGVPLDEVKGSGPKGRITQEDVQAFVKAVMAGARRTLAQGASAPRPRRGAGRRRPRAAAVAEGRLREIRPGRAQSPVAHQEDLRRQPASQLGDDSARHESRRCRHHRSRGAPRPANKENEKPASR